ncbi:MAG: antibiotic biosynthesis monooxygenase [Proteobacteria bacterium]|nr:MAG: antibiotic biosynthesis monooxygenase [Pseudomonadota bacterium]
MIVVAGEIDIDPAHRDGAVAAAVRMMEATRGEPGCISYAFSADLAEPGRFRIFEEWESQQALDAHFAAPHMAAFQRAVAGFGVRRIAIQRYEVSSVGPVR